MSITEDRKVLETTTIASSQDILRNIGFRIANDESRQDGILEILNNIALNTSPLGLDQNIVVKTITTDTKTLLVETKAFERIVVYGVFLSSDDVATFTLIDEDDTSLLASFYGTAASVFMNRVNEKGIVLQKNKSLYIKSSATVNYSIDVIYKILEER